MKSTQTTKTATASQKTLERETYIRKDGSVAGYSAPQAQHSPLPWSVQIPEPSSYIDRYVVDGMGNVVAEVGGGHYHLPPDEPNIPANNARLIVASVNQAPALAEALRDIRFISRGAIDENNFGNIQRLAVEALARWESEAGK